MYAKCCLNQNVQEEYGITLGLIEEGESVSNKDWRAVGKKGGNGGTSSGGNDAMGIEGWGIPVK